jgi:hypothetical protein
LIARLLFSCRIAFRLFSQLSLRHVFISFRRFFAEDTTASLAPPPLIRQIAFFFRFRLSPLPVAAANIGIQRHMDK